MAEEGGVYARTVDERFIVDPLDGTTNYAHRYPLFCVSIAYERGGVLEAAAIDAPLIGLRFAGRRGGWRDPQRGADSGLRRAGADRGADLHGVQPGQLRTQRPLLRGALGAGAGVRRDGSAALDLAFVAAGRFDAFWEWDLKPWDVAAGALLIAEAGGPG